MGFDVFSAEYSSRLSIDDRDNGTYLLFRFLMELMVFMSINIELMSIRVTSNLPFIVEGAPSRKYELVFALSCCLIIAMNSLDHSYFEPQITYNGNRIVVSGLVSFRRTLKSTVHAAK